VIAMNLIRPRRLLPGDTIGVVAPSSPVAAVCPRRLERGVAHLESLGYRVKLGDNVRKKKGHAAGTIEERLHDLHAMFADPDVKMIITTIGGSCSHHLLEDLDFDLIRQNPKIFMGYSDITALHLAIHERTGLVTFLGPAVLPQFGEFGGLLPYTRDYWERAILRPDPVGAILPSEGWIEEHLRWETEDDRPRELVPNPGLKVLKEGFAEGPLLAANMGTMLLLAGTPYFPETEGKILCLEDDPSESPASIDRYLTQFRQMGVFGKIKGLVVGRFHTAVGFTADNSLDDLILQATRGYDFPILTEVDFGHTDPMLTLPNGVRARLDTTEAHPPHFAILEAAVL
jgi:muramoyltetrapeptide carboxypeptidase